MLPRKPLVFFEIDFLLVFAGNAVLLPPLPPHIVVDVLLVIPRVVSDGVTNGLHPVLGVASPRETHLSWREFSALF